MRKFFSVLLFFVCFFGNIQLVQASGPIDLGNTSLDSTFGYDATKINYQEPEKDNFFSSLRKTGNGMGFSDEQKVTTITERAGQYMGVAISFLGVLFLIYAIYGGYLWMTAQGDAKKVEEAKDIITRAVIGLIIIVSAYAITVFVGDFASKVATPV